MEGESEEDVGEHYELISDGQRYWTNGDTGHGQHLGESVMAQIGMCFLGCVQGKGQAETVQPVQSPASP